MEKLGGGELLERITRKESYSEQDAKDCFRQIVLGLKALRHFRIVHRDIKPENLLLLDNSENSKVRECGCFVVLNPAKQIKIGDFGLAVRLALDEKLDESVGTPNYIAPEVLIVLPLLSFCQFFFLKGVVMC